MKTCKHSLIVVVLAMLITSCKDNIQEKEIEKQQIRKEVTAAAILGNPDYLAISYGGYRMTSRDIQPTIADLKEDMKILQAMNIKILRTYNVQLAQASNLLKAIKELKQEDPDFEMYVMLGAWIDCLNAWTEQTPNHEIESPNNAAEIKRAVALAQEYPDIVKIIAVGNEAMVKWAAAYFVQPDVILKWVTHLQNLKKQGALPKDLWITSSDNFASWGGGESQYHVKSQQIEAAMKRAQTYAIKQYDSVASYMQSLGLNKPIHIGETGWASASNGLYGPDGSRATDEYKEALYYTHMRDWTLKKGISCFQLKIYSLIVLVTMCMACTSEQTLEVDVYETAANGNKLTPISTFSSADNPIDILLSPEKELQTITGFGGAFTESSAYLLNRLSKKNRDTILQAYFSAAGANYSLTRTHMNSCDFSLTNYSYAEVVDDMELEHFTIDEDRDDLIPMIKDAMAVSEEGFKIFASPWTAPRWMKDNKDWVGGKLLPKYYDTWALFFSKYVDAYQAEGIDIWGFTVENEPHGNGNNWESMHFTPKEMTDFVQHHLGPKLKTDGKGDLKILGYDQNRKGLKEWVDAMYATEETSKYFDGTAIHWYESTYEVFPEELQYAHHKAPNKYLIETEGCVDSEVPAWKDDMWYWSKESTDWGWDWAPEEDKPLHPKYAPVNRYARDIIPILANTYVQEPRLLKLQNQRIKNSWSPLQKTQTMLLQ